VPSGEGPGHPGPPFFATRCPGPRDDWRELKRERVASLRASQGEPRECWPRSRVRSQTTRTTGNRLRRHALGTHPGPRTEARARVATRSAPTRRRGPASPRACRPRGRNGRSGGSFNWSCRLSSTSWLRMYSRIAASSRPIVETECPLAQEWRVLRAAGIPLQAASRKPDSADQSPRDYSDGQRVSGQARVLLYLRRRTVPCGAGEGRPPPGAAIGPV